MSIETVGVAGREEYYDRTGAMRDMMQNHMFQLLCLTAMEPPALFEANALRDEKVKVLRAVRTGAKNVRAQYDGYRAEAGEGLDGSTHVFGQDRELRPCDDRCERPVVVQEHRDRGAGDLAWRDRRHLRCGGGHGEPGVRLHGRSAQGRRRRLGGDRRTAGQDQAEAE